MIDITEMNIGDQCYLATTDTTRKTHECPDCLGSGEWLAKSPAGEVLTARCPRCSGFGGLDHHTPSLNYTEHTGLAVHVQVKGICHTAKGVKVDVSNVGESSNSWWTFDESSGRLFATEQAALEAAQLLADQANQKERAKPEAIEHGRVGWLKFSALAEQSVRGKVFDVTYHAGRIAQVLREAMQTEDGSDLDDADALERLRRLTNNVDPDLNYHSKQLPMTDLFRAIEGGDSDEIQQAFSKIDQPVRDLLCGRSIFAKPETTSTDWILGDG